jgi:hypothetical protein
MTQSTIQPDSLFQKGTSGEYYLQVKSVTAISGKYEYLLMDADLHEYKATASVLYPVGKLLLCMVRFKLNKKIGQLLIEKVGICSEQSLMPQPNIKESIRREAKKDDANMKLSEMEQAKRASLVDDVKRLIEARENGQTNGKLKSEITRLYQIIVEDKLQEVVVEGCGRDSLKKLFGMARSIRRKEKKKKDKQWLSGKSDSQEKKLDNTLRNKWLRWFIGMYGLNGKYDMEKQMYNAIQKSAYYLNFVELQNECSTDAQFYQNGLACCYKIAINLKIYKPAPKRRKRTQNSNSITGSPHITRKDWGSAYRPARG